jgi:fermentation-respiration switch protein FrsA (DUF1100 family)
VVTIAAPSEPVKVNALFGASLQTIEDRGQAEVQLAGRPFIIKRQFVDDAAGHKLADKIAHLQRALLVMHSPLDTTVDVSNAVAIFSAAKHPKSFVSLDNADHLLTGREDAAYVAALIAAWSSRYLNA